MSLIAIIPARIGSKRIKEKNIKKFCGIPIILRVIDILKKTNLFSKIYVSTESKKVLKLLKKNNFNAIINRPKRLSQDQINTQEVILDSISKINFKNSPRNMLMCIYPTSVFINKKIIQRSIKLLKKNSRNFIFIAQKYDHPISRGFFLKKNKLQFFNKKNTLTRTQDLSTMYHDAGILYLAYKEVWKKKEILNNNSKCIVVDKNFTNDLDYIDDWKFAESLFNLKKK